MFPALCLCLVHSALAATPTTLTTLTTLTEPATPATVRIATFNIWELKRTKLDHVNKAGDGNDPQLRGAAEIIQRVRPDILLINEIDFDADKKENAALFCTRYLAVSQNQRRPIDFPHIYFEAVNTGEPTGLDLDHDGKTNGPADAQGYGQYPGQYGMAILSRFPLDRAHARTFRKMLWKDMPANQMPDGVNGKPAWYSADQAAVLRLSSKSHWDVPVRINIKDIKGIGGRSECSDRVIHLLCAHPTPPVFDGSEDRNGRRNFDEIRLWADYLAGGAKANYIVDDQNQRGGLKPNASFVILGDLNADATRDPSPYGQPAIDQLLKHPRVHDPAPASPGALGRNKPGPPYHLDRKTCDFGRIDYVLPSTDLKATASGVFWPANNEPTRHLVTDPNASSDHRLVWIDVELK